MKYPIPIKQIPNIAVPKYPRLKSNIEFLIGFCCSLLFSAGERPAKKKKKVDSISRLY